MTGPTMRAECGYRSVHGSRFNAEEFLATVRPRVAIVSVGAHNSYGHPSQHVLDTLAAKGASVLRTDLDGDIAVVGSPRLQVVSRGNALRSP
ncbi:MAG: competence protein ComEC [Pseudonocardiales bacterium]|nr:competence protein ComEC [Pseudonocardiales bacterium]